MNISFFATIKLIVESIVLVVPNSCLIVKLIVG